MSKPLVPGIILDVDGTLVDSTYLHVMAFKRAFRETGHAGVGSARIQRLIGMPADDLIAEVVGREDEEVKEAYSAQFEELQKEARGFPEADAFVRHCRARGLAPVIATSGREEDLDWMLPAIGITKDDLAGVITSSDVEQGKPAPDPFTASVEEFGLDPKRTLVLGDAVWDIESAKNAGLPCVALTCGGTDEDTLRKAGAVAVYDDPAALLAAYDDSPFAALTAG